MYPADKTSGYLAVVADHSLFSWRTLVSLSLFVTAMFKTARQSQLHRAPALAVLPVVDVTLRKMLKIIKAAITGSLAAVKRLVLAAKSFATRAEVTRAQVNRQPRPDLHAQPPYAPWQVFPEIDAEVLGSRQGDFDYWWDNYWWPYWLSLSSSARQQWLHNPAHPAAWREYMQLQESFAVADQQRSD